MRSISVFFLCIIVSYVVVVFFFFKQKTAYEMRISDWSSEVCSSDLLSFTKITDQSVNIDEAYSEFMLKFFVALVVVILISLLSLGWRVGIVVAAAVPLPLAGVFLIMLAKFGRASCRERGCSVLVVLGGRRLMNNKKPHISNK